MNVLIIDHNFKYDIDELLSLERGHVIRVFPADRISQLAHKYFPKNVFASMLGEEYSNPKLEKKRKKYTNAARKMLHNLYKVFPFDCIISPSDTIFYLRAFVSCAHELGLPFIVLQKETSISPFTLVEEAKSIGCHLPFISDLMLVCSEHHKQFWKNTGADSSKIVVTGQPRFDFYARAKISPGQARTNSKPTLLFFSYDLGAYSPDGVLSKTWFQLRSETEKVLIDLVNRGRLNLYVKPHPQQQDVGEYKEWLYSLSRENWGSAIKLIPAESDARSLICQSDIVVGFQTTALFEALAAKKKVIYTYWSDAVRIYSENLLPFAKMSNVIEVASSPEQLKSCISSNIERSSNSATSDINDPEVLKQLGPIDGKSSERCWELIEDFTSKFSSRTSLFERSSRENLSNQSASYCRWQLMKMLLLFWFFSKFNTLLSTILLSNSVKQYPSVFCVLKRARNRTSSLVSYIKSDISWCCHRMSVVKDRR